MGSELDRAQTRRQFLKGVAAVTALAGAGTGAGVGIWKALSGDDGGTGPRDGAAPGAQPSLDDFAQNVVAGGPGRGGIPALNEPKFVPASDADFLRDDDFVFGLADRGEPRAYPQPVLVYHEIVNDEIAGEPVSVTYCPLTGSVVAFRGKAPDGRPLTFNTTGSLVNSNLLMFDRETDSEWPQILATAISGPQKGARLDETPLVWSAWSQWRARHPDTLVLSADTGFGRPYGQDPYGSYAPLGGYYEGGGPIFPVMAENGRFPPKEVVVGVKAGESRLAVAKGLVEETGVLPLELDATPFVAFWDEELATARVFASRAGGRIVRFRRGSERDRGGSTWSATGEALDGPMAGAKLPTADFLDVMWFSWFAFFPQTKVVA